MNDFSQLENELRKLRPVQPSADLLARIEGALVEEESLHPRQSASPARTDGAQASTAGVLLHEHRFHFNWLSIGLGLAAATALVLFAFLRLQQPAQKTATVASTAPALTTSNDKLVPAGLTQVVYHTRDEGLQFSTNSTEPMRRMRSHSRDTLQWRNQKTGATLRISYPREEVSLVPVSGQ